MTHANASPTETGRLRLAKNGTAANRRPGYAYLHHAVDDHSRLAYSYILSDEKKETAAGFWQHARELFNTGIGRS